MLTKTQIHSKNDRKDYGRCGSIRKTKAIKQKKKNQNKIKSLPSHKQLDSGLRRVSEVQFRITFYLLRVFDCSHVRTFRSAVGMQKFKLFLSRRKMEKTGVSGVRFFISV